MTNTIFRRRFSHAAIVLATVLVGVVAFPANAAPDSADAELTSTNPDSLCLSCAYETSWDVFELDGAVEASVNESADLTIPSVAGSLLGEPGSGWNNVGQSTERGERLPYTREEKALVWSFIALNVIDTYQTMNIPDGNIEGNPVLSSIAGSHPSALETMAYKTAMTYGVLKVTQRIRNPKTRRAVLYALNVLQLYVDAHNESVTGGIVF